MRKTIQRFGNLNDISEKERNKKTIKYLSAITGGNKENILDMRNVDIELEFFTDDRLKEVVNNIYNKLTDEEKLIVNYCILIDMIRGEDSE